MRISLRTTCTLFLMASAAALAQPASWKSVAPQGFDGFVGGIDFPSRDTGYAAASSSSIDTETGSILMSTDRGERWTIKSFEGASLFDVKFADRRKGYAAGRNAGCDCGVIYSTSDAGATWTPRTYPATTYFLSLFFLDGNLGFAAGDDGMILKTTNGGIDWTPLASAVSSEISLKNIFFATPNVGYMIGGQNGRLWPNLILKTTDGGSHWTTIVDNGTDTETKPTYSSLFFVSADTGFATGREGATKTIYRTTNGGSNWEKVFTANAAGTLFSMGGIQFINSNLGYASGDEGTIVRTTDGGKTWRRETSGVNTALPAIEFIDENTGLVGGLFGSLIKRSIPLEPMIKVDRSELDFDTVNTGSRTMTVSIDARNELGLRVDSIYIQNRPGKTTGFAVESPKGPFPFMIQQGNPREVTVSYTAVAGFEGDVRADLMIKTNASSSTNLAIPLFASQESVEAPSAELSTTQLAFGDVVEGRTKEMSLTLGAANSTGLRVDSITITSQSGGDLFELIAPAGPTPIDILPGAPLTFTVRFRPATAGVAAQSSLEIRTNDPANGTLSVALTGTAITAPAGVGVIAGADARLTVRSLPNPIERNGYVSINTPREGHVRVALYDLLGRRVADLHDARSSAGMLTVPIEADELPNGIYYCIVKAGGERASCEIIVHH